MSCHDVPCQAIFLRVMPYFCVSYRVMNIPCHAVSRFLILAPTKMFLLGGCRPPDTLLFLGGLQPPRPTGGGLAAPRTPLHTERLRLSGFPFFLVPRSWYQDPGTKILVIGEPMLGPSGWAQAGPKWVGPSWAQARNLGPQKIQKKISKSKSVLPKMSARSGLVGKKSSWPHLGPSGPIFCVGRKSPKNAKENAYFPRWANGPYSPLCSKSESEHHVNLEDPSTEKTSGLNVLQESGSHVFEPS